MGCVASKLEGEEEVVSICKERKRQLKLAVERRHALAEAHCRYCHALYAVAAAIDLFVARHSSHASQFLITFPPPCPPPPMENVVNNPMFLQQRPSDSTTHEAIACESCGSLTSSDSSEEEREEEEAEEEEEEEEERAEQPCGYFYMEMPPSMPSPQRDFGWDFFNSFDSMRPEVISGYRRSSDDDLRVVREEEGIPELEEEGDREEQETKVVMVEENGDVEHESGVEEVKVVDGANVNQGEHKGLTVIDTPVVGRELLDALKDIEDHFIRAFDSGKDVSRMLEANRVYLQSNLEEIKENSTKLIQAITCNRSTSSRTSSCKSLVASSSKSSSTWTEYKNDLFDDYGGMASGSHSLTLGRLYAWEKKLYEEVKAGDSTRKIYEKKCLRLRNQDVRGDGEQTLDKTRAAVKDLYARILVAIRSAESISMRIQKLRDEELQPQIVELLKGLTRTWKIMLESHETQNKILFEVRSFTCPTFGKFCNDTHRLATLQLEAELHNWRACLMEYVTAQKRYVEALHGWLAKFVVPEVEFYSRGRNSAVPYRVDGPPLLVICRDWLASINKLPDKAVAFALKSFAKDVKALWVQQGEEQQQKRKVDSLAKDIDRRILAFEKTESRFLESKFTNLKLETEEENRDEYLTDKKDQLDSWRRKLDVEKEKHHNCMQETQRITLNGFQTGFSTVFESLMEFSKASKKMYNDLVTCSENAEKAGNLSYIEGSMVEDNGSR
ncbi:protein ALTERED PHOSPHATE STARVATION RESPONSE 1-like [Juglans microcarpa x Juglans regia]|uniref:protein ALTERED PHOSPHATE STARVATION RESPONSE 1-like n=1 Tax=Juglans microcarpa x Juglans regia TaxID=2249226 RepID=UPI001B7F30E6|nr:protein ALTERED PHOSPHATE STARVATION RESPONSE 1-like [Juglans microcarpa x Juglans regia]